MAGRAGPPVPDGLADQLYALCASHEPDKYYFQEDFLDFNIIPRNDLEILLGCIQTLLDRALLKHYLKDNVPCWRIVRPEDAAK
jgi:DNA-directed RNA polymerase III subunit RPC6